MTSLPKKNSLLKNSLLKIQIPPNLYKLRMNAKLHEKELFVFDMDGVLYRTSEPIPTGLEAVKKLRQMGKKVAFLTNNSTKTQTSFAQKLQTMGLEAQPDEIFTSAYITAKALASKYQNATVFVIGELGLISTLKDYGFHILNEQYPELENVKKIPDGIVADLVIQGMDTTASYNKLRTAMMLILNGSKWFVTNDDASFPAPGTLWPGSGAGVAFLQAALDRAPDKIFGKPHPDGLEFVLDYYQIKPSQAVLVGDRLNTDILGGNRAKMTTVFVETGISKRTELTNLSQEYQPTYIFSDLTEMIANHF